MYLAWNFTYLAETALWLGDLDQAAHRLATIQAALEPAAFAAAFAAGREMMLEGAFATILAP